MQRDGCEHVVRLTFSTSCLDTPTFPNLFLLFSHLLLGSPGTWWNLAPRNQQPLFLRGVPYQHNEKMNMSCACLHLPSRIMVCSGKWPIGLYRKRFLGEPFSTCMIVGGRISRKHRPLQKVTCMSQSLMHQQPFKLRLTEHITVSSNLQTKLTRTHTYFTLLKLAKICKCNRKNKRNKHWQQKNIRSMIRTQILSIVKT